MASIRTESSSAPSAPQAPVVPTVQPVQAVFSTPTWQPKKAGAAPRLAEITLLGIRVGPLVASVSGLALSKLSADGVSSLRVYLPTKGMYDRDSIIGVAPVVREFVGGGSALIAAPDARQQMARLEEAIIAAWAAGGNRCDGTPITLSL